MILSTKFKIFRRRFEFSASGWKGIAFVTTWEARGLRKKINKNIEFIDNIQWIFYDPELIDTWFLHELDAFICKALKGEAIVNELLRALNNTAYESLQLALWVKIDEKKRSSSDLPFG